MDLFTETDVQRLIDYIRSTYDPSQPLVLWADGFCGGGGGVGQGYKQTPNNYVVAAFNHDIKVIEINKLNHPHCIHYIEDARDWALIWKLESLFAQLRKEFPEALVGLHASLECTFFSNAKGGESREEDSRTLGYCLEKYLCFKPDYITVENVREFLKWGPVEHITRKKAGKTEWKYKEGNKVYWLDTPDSKEYPKFTLPIKERECEDYDIWRNMFTSKGYEYDYRILNAADYGESTKRQRYFGLFALNGLPIAFPSPTHVERSKHHLFPHLKVWNAVRDKLNLQDVGVSIFGLNGNGKKYVSATISRAEGGLEKFANEGYFTSSYHGASQNGQGVNSIWDPLGAIPCKDSFSYHHIQYAFGKPTYSMIDEPLQAITTVPKAELISTTWLYDHQFDNKGGSINEPCHTIIARQDKKPIMMGTASRKTDVDNSIPEKGDCKARISIKKLMRKLGVTDISIRALYDYELASIQGFPDTYIFSDSVTLSKKAIGNSVCPGQAKANSDALYIGLKNYKQAS